MNPILLKVKIINGQKNLFPLAGQTFPNGQPVETTLMTTARKVISPIEGELYGTNSLTKHDKFKYYTTGAELYLLADEDGMFVHPDNADNATHEAYIQYAQSYDENGSNVPNIPVKKAGQLSLMDKLRKDKSLACPTLEHDLFYVEEETWYHLLRQQHHKANTLLVGESGAGKTELLILMAQKLQKECNVFDMAITNPTKVLCGNLRAENGTTYYQYSRFAESIQRESINILDEISRAHPTANNILLPVTDSRRKLYIEDAIDDVIIPVHEKASIWATANIGAKFTGTQMLDHALLNRFQQILIEYPPHDKEAEVLMRRSNLDRSNAFKIMEIVDKIRKNDMLSKDVSTRQAIEVARMVYDGYPIYKAFERSILIQFQEDGSAQSERATVKAILQG